VFIARGTGPFALVRAPAGEQSVAMPLDALIPERADDDALPAARATVAAVAPAATTASAASAIVAPPPPAGSNTPWLWAALLAALAVLGTMAWSLLRRPAAAQHGEGA
jgi:hypothetical protein